MGEAMALTVNDANHRRWRDQIEGLVEEWKAVIDVREGVPADEVLTFEPTQA
jgi:hypothetical protein